MTNNKQYWKGEEDLVRDPSFIQASKNEFSEGLPLEEVLNESDFELSSNRRDFLKMFGFSVSAVALAACNKAPVRNAIPYLIKPDDVTPGVPNYYSSTCGITGMPIEVKTREGRPIKIDGNPRVKALKGGFSVAGQAAVYDLYDNERLKKPLRAGKESNWAAVDKDISKILNNLSTAGEKIALVSNTINSPSTLSAINDFKTKYESVEHIQYDPISYSGIIEANRMTFGQAVIPSYHFDKADVIVSFNADFLDTWLLGETFSVDYVSRRTPGDDMSKHIQFESALSLTGSNADVRYPMQTRNEGMLLVSLYNELAQLNGVNQLPVVGQADVAGQGVKKTAAILNKAKGKSLVVCGSNNPKNQGIVNAINSLLGNYTSTININNPIKRYAGSDAQIQSFAKDLAAGAYAGVIFYGSNPVFDTPYGDSIAKGLKNKIKLSISSCSNLDETGKLCQFVTPDNHFLESWNDYQPLGNLFTLGQPTISPVFDTRQMQVSLLTWAGNIGEYNTNTLADKGIYGEKQSSDPYYNYIKSKWAVDDKTFNTYLHDGYVQKEDIPATAPSFIANAVDMAASIEAESKQNKEGIELTFIEKTGIAGGKMANNPLVQELPDPISKVTWHNYIAMAKANAEKLGVKDNTVVNVTIGKDKFAIPAIIQPGQANGTASIHLGYGRKVAGKVGKGRGVNGFASINGGEFTNYTVQGAKIEATSEEYKLARTQTHHHIEGRDIIRETTLDAYKKDKKAGNRYEKPQVVSLWYEHDYQKDGAPNHLWGMAIDMNKCTGCSACIVSCSVENNVPVVGEVEVRRRREMHWLRIDRYYTFNNVNNVDYEDAVSEVNLVATSADFEGDKITKEKALKAIDHVEAQSTDPTYAHYENVSVVHQPMLCQHCGSAPCETVCPVLATTHSTEGLNQMTYNRCIGTKYCGNNCPYKVRRFNWFRYNDNAQFDFHFSNDLGKMVINPDVTVRTRGVMEKCSFCVQRIQSAKLSAKREGRKLEDGDVKTACQRACPADAIVFGDLHDKNSEVRQLFQNERAYSVLEELNVKPSIRYMTKVRNV